ncbi:uncharacterized protein (DUF1778 family) [Parvibaculum indicum]|uniref:type II toxin-antitoxin system HicB family antitoxin n=1 Tax=Parvibaculum indicum TaxID=562969 RepID=UPI0014221465|nr:type II toxin-antitoxin system HicB family antitoxin [Parvibaculum indicum]NIJ40330.1 uncharacterized protein (DUF1778 family) [Parvibaculum indicum]
MRCVFKHTAIRVNITAPEDAMQEIDAYAEEHGFTRSGFLIQAAMEKVRTPKRAA